MTVEKLIEELKKFHSEQKVTFYNPITKRDCEINRVLRIGISGGSEIISLTEV